MPNQADHVASPDPITLCCRVCGEILSDITDTNQALTHVIENHPNALIVSAALASLYVNSNLFMGAEAADRTRWHRNLGVFQEEFLSDLCDALSGGSAKLAQMFGGEIDIHSKTPIVPTLIPAPPAPQLDGAKTVTCAPEKNQRRRGFDRHRAGERKY